jgi:hypothetical protein
VAYVIVYVMMVLAHFGQPNQQIIATDFTWSTEEDCVEEGVEPASEIKQGHPDWEPLAFACRPVEQADPA